MPRTARKKQEDAIYHVMCRSISEIQLFKSDEDKETYMSLIKQYKKMFDFIIYAYCLMDNHVHLIIYSNGADISKIMHCINFRYATYYNAKYERHGHLFQDRFKSKIVTDDRYLVTLSAYIHNNPLDIEGYENSPEKYYYSSLGIYLGLRKDELNILDKEFILGMFGENKNMAKERYLNILDKYRETSINDLSKEDSEFQKEKCEYRSERKALIRNFEIDNIVKYVLDKFKMEKSLLHVKYKRNNTYARGILAFLLRNLCNVSCKSICSILGNITSSRVSKLSSIGIKLICDNNEYRNIIDDFLKCYSKK